jgi:16S rRNA processing protein RimM
LPNRPILLGVIGRAHGVRGLARVTSHTADPTALAGYGPLSDPSGRRFTLRWMAEGIAEIAEIINGEPVKIADRTAAERLTNTKLFIERDRLPPPEPDEYYLADLIGLAAIDKDGSPVGVVSAVHDYGAGVSLEVDRADAGSLLIPFTAACVPEVNIAAGFVTIVPPDEIDVPETDALPDDPADASDRHPGNTTGRNPPTDPGRHSPTESNAHPPAEPERQGAGTDPRDPPAHDARAGRREAAA